MTEVSPVFQQTRAAYLELIRGVDITSIAETLGFAAVREGFEIHLFNSAFTMTADDIVDAKGRPAAFDVCVLLSRYLIMCPEIPDERMEWTAYRDFKDAGPLLKYYADNVEGAIAAGYGGRRDDLVIAAAAMSGTLYEEPLAYDVAVRFEALPRIGMLLLFNDADDEFGAECRVLFERRTESYLDMECVAILGARLAVGLCRI